MHHDHVRIARLPSLPETIDRRHRYGGRRMETKIDQISSDPRVFKCESGRRARAKIHLLIIDQWKQQGPTNQSKLPYKEKTHQGLVRKRDGPRVQTRRDRTEPPWSLVIQSTKSDGSQITPLHVSYRHNQSLSRSGRQPCPYLLRRSRAPSQTKPNRTEPNQTEGKAPMPTQTRRRK